MRPSPGLARAQERWLVDTCEIVRPGAAAFDSVAGTYTPAAGETIYCGPCLVTSHSASRHTDATVATLEEVLGRYKVTLPASAEGVQVEDVLTVTTTDDADLADEPFVVTDVPVRSWDIDQTLTIERRQPTP